MTENFSAIASVATADALEFPSLLAVCAELAACDLGRDRVMALTPLGSVQELERRQRLLRDAGRLLEQQSPLVPSQDDPLRPLLDGLEQGELQIGGRELVRIGAAIGITRHARETIRSAEVETPAIEELVSPLPDLEPLRRRIAKSLDARGRVRDDASPQLSRLRRRVHRLRDGLYQQLQQALGQDREHFATDTVSLKEGRLTLLLHSGAKGRLKGVVHGRSGTGQSLYFEPLAVMEDNNRLQETLEEEEAERQRILIELIDEAQTRLPAIRSHFDLLGELDLLQSLIRFAELSGSILPDIASDGVLRLVAARHPLLDPLLASLREAALGQPGHRLPVVPLDLELDREHRFMVITGPNAGGKTVALKTAGLLALAAQSGMPIPAAAGTRLPLFEAVMAMVGDEQDLLADRSTFSARLIRLREAWEIAGESSLVLLDELGSGTDPEEGSALAMALLEGLLESGSVGIVTTHLTQVAAMALERDGAACAAMEFDSESGEPTYHLRPGAPGGSQALALGRRLGLPEPWLTRAESLLGAEHRDLRKLLAEVEAVRQQLAAAQAEREREAEDLGKVRRRLENELAATTEERRQVGRRLKSELDEFRTQVMLRLRDEVEKTRQEVRQGRTKTVVGAAVERMFEGAPEYESEEETGVALVPGASVRHRALGWTGELTRVRGGKADVTVLGKRIRCNLDDLTGLREAAAPESPRGPAVRLVGGSEESADLPLELNLVGVRIEPALELLDRYLDQALLSSRRQVRVVHGFGSGRLRKAVREYLEPHPAVREFRPGRENEGGDGATVVTLDKS